MTEEDKEKEEEEDKPYDFADFSPEHLKDDYFLDKHPELRETKKNFEQLGIFYKKEE